MFLSVKNELYIFWCIKESRVDCSKDETKLVKEIEKSTEFLGTSRSMYRISKDII